MSERKVHLSCSWNADYPECSRVNAWSFTNDVTKVTCGNCKNTLRYKELVGALKNSSVAKVTDEMKTHFKSPETGSDACYKWCLSDKHTTGVTKVTCGCCKKTKVYKKALAEYEKSLKVKTTIDVDARTITEEVLPTTEESKEVIESIEKKVIDALWETTSGGSGNLPCMVVQTGENYILCVEEQEPERFFKITVTEMEIVEKRSNEG